ncbi:lasso peptide biosynthesis B2 protein [Qipengyuania sp. 1XM1-15A]|uniref:lasso peptide biosynthesis B2 protein n=1 Tax=Qipengyuania xiamenensis TaxID=2867237 RepID=UPI001C87F941|nr:lasso peptide biosynthesis B2 protein [Qipengyuania xiamenensis]MBX7533256.1 lasso peptide biosynthesis B2 protein [Qipengyuania xiamenensis]
MSKLRTFFALDSVDKIATFEAIAMVLYAKFLVASVPPRKWRNRFGAIATHSTKQDADLATVRRVRLAILRALNNVPGSPNCLPQALTGRWMLERRGIASSLFIGTQRDADGKMQFHAWLKVGEEWVTGICEEADYTLLLPGDAETA